MNKLFLNAKSALIEAIREIKAFANLVIAFLSKIYWIAKSVLIEAVRRKEIYAIVLISVLIIGAVMSVDFFNLEGIEKFYREIALQVMSTATALTVIVLSARQLPREFETRTIYPLLAKPVSRFQFLFGKLLGVMLAAIFCFAIFMTIYILGVIYLKGEVPVGLFVQYLWLQIMMLLVISTMSFWLSLKLNLDAAITISSLLYVTASVISTLTTMIYDSIGPIQQWVIKLIIYVLPQLSLFDLSEKTIHADQWGPVSAKTLTMVTGYGLVYTVIFFSLALLSFRRRPL